MSQYPVPQFIEEEGKIVYFLTYRQFFLLVGGGAVCVFWYLILPPFLFIPFTIATMLLFAAIAFVKMNNVGLISMLFRIIGFSIGPKKYVWHKKEGGYVTNIEKTSVVKIIPEISVKPTLNMQPSKLRNIQKIIDTKK